MLFNSSEFCLFFLIVFCAYYLARNGSQQLFILVGASFVFYGWSNPTLLLLLVGFIVVNAAANWMVAKSSERSQRVFWAACGVIVDVVLLAIFKYAHSVAYYWRQLSGVDSSNGNWAVSLASLPLPIGISFFTFEAISLLVETARQPTSQRNLKHYIGNMSLFFSFFPHLVAGPIVRPYQFLPQIGHKRLANVNWKKVIENLVLGYFLKVVVADGLAETLDLGFTFQELYSGANHVVNLIGYSTRIFADFAGYSAIAIGLAAALGYELPANFNLPYIAESLSEFWKRWHMTLSSWFKDYLYIPLGGNRIGKFRTYANLMIVMFIGGLWHGGSYRFGLWGLFHGAGLVCERALSLDRPASMPLIRACRRLFVFAFVSLGWLTFALPLNRAVEFLKVAVEHWNYQSSMQPILLISCLSSPVLLWHLAGLFKERRILGNPMIRDLAFGLALFFVVVNAGTAKEFVYFQF